MPVSAVLGYAFQFLSELLKLHAEGNLTKEKAQAATDLAIGHLHQVGDPS